ncbi:hypothetical protein F0562_005311 [Nyssa sinensis]|uniref:Core Histone H2A/H2B/H3 domain-containing protein n=1 Tax=Nyssa sinensis TaxID=561372 RepID=A0A5J5ALA6_9ASTE|nr:hypothetical protein F0562_005311 [Nyssa sinensis]
MDLNQSIEFSSSSAPPAQIHNFMPMPAAYMLPHNHQDGEAVRRSHFIDLLKQNIELFWSQQMFEIHNTSDFRSQHRLPLARIKKIMKSDEQVKMISADTPILFSKACELFILELTLRAWLHTEESRRRTLQRCDIARAIRHDDLLDFLVDFVQLDEHKEEETGINLENMTESYPVRQMHLPMMNMNRAFAARNQEIMQQYMVQLSMSSAELKYEPDSK